MIREALLDLEGMPVVRRVVLSGSSAETIYTCPNDRPATATGVNVFNASGGTVTVEIAVHDGSTTFKHNAESVSDDAWQYFNMNGTLLEPDDEIRVTGASGVHVIFDGREMGRQ